MALPSDLYDLDSPASILLRILIFAVATIIVAQLVEIFLERYLRRASTRLRVGVTKYLALRRLIVAAIYITGVIVLIYSTPQLASLSIAIFTSVSIIAIIVGIAAQSTISNVIAGIAIVVFKPFRVGDFITVRGDSGFVEDITFRHTIIRLLDRHMIIPNSTITGEVVFNHSNDKVGSRIDIRVSYGSKLPVAKRVIKEQAEREAVVDKETIKVFVSKTDEFGVTLSLVFKLDGSPFDCVSNLREALVVSLVHENVTLT